MTGDSTVVISEYSMQNDLSSEKLFHVIDVPVTNLPNLKIAFHAFKWKLFAIKRSVRCKLIVFHIAKSVMLIKSNSYS